MTVLIYTVYTDGRHFIVSLYLTLSRRCPEKIVIVQLFLGITHCGSNVFLGVKYIILDSFVIMRAVYYQVGNLSEVDRGLRVMVPKYIIILYR